MDRGTGEAATRINRPLVGVQTRESRQQRRMDIEQTPGVGRHKARTENAHEPGQHHQRGYVSAAIELRNLPPQCRVKSLATGKPRMVHHCGGQPRLLCQRQSAGIRAVADDSRDAGTQGRWPVLLVRGAHDGCHIGATARDQNHDIAHAGIIRSGAGAYSSSRTRSKVAKRGTPPGVKPR